MKKNKFILDTRTHMHKCIPYNEVCFKKSLLY